MKTLLLPVLLFVTCAACASNPKTNFQKDPFRDKPPEPVFVKVYPEVSIAGLFGTTVRIDYRIARNPDNRSFRLTWGDEDGLIGSTGKSLNGENELYAFPPVFVEHLYPGSYQTVLSVLRIENGKEKEYRASHKFLIK